MTRDKSASPGIELTGNRIKPAVSSHLLHASAEGQSPTTQGDERPAYYVGEYAPDVMQTRQISEVPAMPAPLHNGPDALLLSASSYRDYVCEGDPSWNGAEPWKPPTKLLELSRVLDLNDYGEDFEPIKIDSNVDPDAYNAFVDREEKGRQLLWYEGRHPIRISYETDGCVYASPMADQIHDSMRDEAVSLLRLAVKTLGYDYHAMSGTIYFKKQIQGLDLAYEWIRKAPDAYAYVRDISTREFPNTRIYSKVVFEILNTQSFGGQAGILQKINEFYLNDSRFDLIVLIKILQNPRYVETHVLDLRNKGSEISLGDIGGGLIVDLATASSHDVFIDFGAMLNIPKGDAGHEHVVLYVGDVSTSIRYAEPVWKGHCLPDDH